MKRFDIAIIGGGILGCATAYHLTLQFPRTSICILEKESGLATHQTGHNSGVIHSGIYYRPGSMKALNCVSGARALMSFCEESGVRYDLCGKVVVATGDGEIEGLKELHRRGEANGVSGLELIGPERLQELEPHSEGVLALHSPRTGIVDYRELTRAYAKRAVEAGGQLLTGHEVLSIRTHARGHHLQTGAADIEAANLVNCAGLHSDTVAKMAGLRPDIRIIPFRGEYYMLSPSAHHLVNGLIYPVPDPEFPFLGVHFTRTIDGHVEAGPNAVLAFAREGYSMGRISPSDLAGLAGYPGFWRMASRYWRTGAREFRRSLSKRAFTQALQKLVPDLREQDLARGAAGVRAQAVDRTGSLVDDFRIVASSNAVHVLNAPSPGATASLAIGEHIAGMARRAFGLGGSQADRNQQPPHRPR